MNLFVDVMNQSLLMDSDNTVLVELMVMFGDHQLSTLHVYQSESVCRCYESVSCTVVSCLGCYHSLYFRVPYRPIQSGPKK